MTNQQTPTLDGRRVLRARAANGIMYGPRTGAESRVRRRRIRPGHYLSDLPLFLASYGPSAGALVVAVFELIVRAVVGTLLPRPTA